MSITARRRGPPFVLAGQRVYEAWIHCFWQPLSAGRSTQDAACKAAIIFVIDIPAYDHYQEMAKMAEMNIGRLDEWNAKASRMQPYSAFSSHADVEDGPEANSNTSTADFRDTATPRGFSTLPVDLLGLIARHVYPKDVISLARVDKRARRYLMSRDNRVVWQDVLQKMHEGPKCPPFMSEPHYVALLFGRDCMGCGSAPGTFVALGWRLCQSCKIRNLILDSEVKDRFRKVLYFRRLHEHPVFYSTDPKRRAFHPSDILPHCVLPVPGVKDKMRHFYAPEVDQFLTEYLPIVLRLIERGDAAVEVWCLIIGRRRAYVAQMNEFLEDVRALFEALSRPRTLRSQIVDRIRVLDFSPRDMPEGLPEWDSALSTYAVLTDEHWDRLRPVLLPHLEQKRAARLEGLRGWRVWGPHERLPHEELE